jgi:proteasome lid subunit RPN8/RPN11
MTFTRLVISEVMLAETVEHARQELPNECCGLLGGHLAENVGIVTSRYPLANALRSPTEYLSDPRDMIAAFRQMREHRLELLAIYHSHPTSPPVPSRRDLDRNTYGELVVHLIVGLGGLRPEVRAWRLAERDYREAEFVVAGASGS